MLERRVLARLMTRFGRVLLLSMIPVLSSCGEDDGPLGVSRLLVVASDPKWTGQVEGMIEESGESFIARPDLQTIEDLVDDCDAEGFVVESGRLTLRAEGGRGLAWRIEEELLPGECRVVELSLATTTSAFFAIFAGNEAAVPMRVTVDGQALPEVDHAISDGEWRSLGEANWIQGPDGIEWDEAGGGQRRRLLELAEEGKTALFIGPAGEYEVFESYSWGYEESGFVRLDERDVIFSIVQFW